MNPGKPLDERCVRASPQTYERGQPIYGLSAEVRVERDVPVWTPEPLLDITILTEANRQNVTKRVSGHLKIYIYDIKYIELPNPGFPHRMRTFAEDTVASSSFPLKSPNFYPNSDVCSIVRYRGKRRILPVSNGFLSCV